MSFRITDVDCIGRAKTPQLNLPGVVWWPNVYIYIYIHIYIYIYIYCDIPAAHDGAQGLSLQCPATAPTEGVAVQGHCMQVRLHGSRGGCLRWPPTPPGPRWPPANKRSFTSIQMVHTHAPQQRGRWDDGENDMKVKMEWKLPNQDAKRGTQEKRERANTNTTHLARNGQKPRKGKEKEKAEADGHGPRPAEEGEDGSAWTNLTKRNLSLPRHAQDPTYLKRGERRNTWERGPMGD